MYKYKVEVFDKGEGFPFNLKLYETITADGYCAELEARKSTSKCYNRTSHKNQRLYRN